MFYSDRAARELKRLKASRVMLQVPEGLKQKALGFSRELGESGFTVYLSVEPCFGACDTRDREAKALGCDALVHVGHSDLGKKTAIPVIYEPYFLDFDPVPALEKGMPSLEGFRRIGLLATVQYIPALARASRFLKQRGKEPLTGAPAAGHPGQVLGCDQSSAKSIESQADCFLLIGSGRFHALGILNSVRKPLLFLDAEAGSVSELSHERKRLEAMRNAGIAKASVARVFGILVSSKPGQAHPKEAERARKRLEAIGKESHILVADTISGDKLLGLGIGALVNTACPRIWEDSPSLGVPVIEPGDITVLEEAFSA